MIITIIGTRPISREGARWCSDSATYFAVGERAIHLLVDAFDPIIHRGAFVRTLAFRPCSFINGEFDGSYLPTVAGL